MNARQKQYELKSRMLNNYNLNTDVTDYFKFIDQIRNRPSRYTTIPENITIKKVIYEKNNSFKLSDGRTIQEAIVENTILRKVKHYYESLLEKRDSKKRITEVNNSYFECKTLNYNVQNIQNKYDEIEKKIQVTDFEISKLNSKEFEINI